MAKRKAKVISTTGDLRKFDDTLLMQFLLKLQEDGLISIDSDFNEEDYNKLVDRFAANVADAYEQKTPEELRKEIEELQKQLREKTGKQEELVPIQHAPEEYRYPTDKETRLILSGAIIPDGEALPIKGTGSYITVFPAENENPSDLPLTTEQYSIMIAIAQAMITRGGEARISGVWLTPDQIFRLMLADDNARMTPENRESIIAAVRYMMCHIAEIQKDGKIWRETMIHASEVENKKLENGNPVKLAWFIKEMPVFMMYALQRGQITAIPKPVVALPAGMNYSGKNLAIRDYLLREIEWMKYTQKHPEKKTGKRAGTRILFNSVFEGCQMQELSNIAKDGTKKKLPDSDRRKANRYKAQIKEFCEHFTRTGEIEGYTAQPDGITVQIS